MVQGATARDPGAITATGKPVKLLLLNGMSGKGSFSKVERVIEHSKLGSEIDVQVWDWTDLEEFDGLISVTGLDPLEIADRLRQESQKTNAAARRLAAELLRWREAQDLLRKDTKIHACAGSAGVTILRLACYADGPEGFILPASFFERVVFLSAAIDYTAPIARVDECTVDGICNYYSGMDRMLQKAEPLFSTPLVGALGYEHSVWDDQANPSGDQYRWVRRELRWSRSMDLDNDGAHLHCNKEKYFARFILPLFDPQGEIPAQWKTNPGWRRPAQ